MSGIAQRRPLLHVVRVRLPDRYSSAPTAYRCHHWWCDDHTTLSLRLDRRTIIRVMSTGVLPVQCVGRLQPVQINGHALGRVPNPVHGHHPADGRVGVVEDQTGIVFGLDRPGIPSSRLESHPQHATHTGENARTATYSERSAGHNRTLNRAHATHTGGIVTGASFQLLSRHGAVPTGQQPQMTLRGVARWLGADLTQQLQTWPAAAATGGRSLNNGRPTPIRLSVRTHNTPHVSRSTDVSSR